MITVTYLTTFVTFIFVVACVWPPPLLPRIDFIETRDSSSRLTTPGPAALDLKFESSRGHFTTISGQTFSLFRKLFFDFFFLANVVPLLLTGKGTGNVTMTGISVAAGIRHLGPH